MTVATPTLAGFLLARIAEDERWAQAVAGIDYGAARDRLRPDDHSRVLRDCRAKRRIVERHVRKEGPHLPRHAICAECGGSDWKPEGGVLQPFPWVMPWPCPTLQALAESYDRHLDYREEWRP